MIFFAGIFGGVGVENSGHSERHWFVRPARPLVTLNHLSALGGAFGTGCRVRGGECSRPVRPGWVERGFRPKRTNRVREERHLFLAWILLVEVEHAVGAQPVQNEPGATGQDTLPALESDGCLKDFRFLEPREDSEHDGE